MITGVTGMTDDVFDGSHPNEVPEMFAQLVRIAMEHLGDEVSFSIAHPQLGL
jgi:hypothetical protein